MNHFKECIPSIDNACAVLSNAQSKLKRNAALFRQVGNLKVQNLTLRKENRHLNKKMKLNDESRRRLELLGRSSRNMKGGNSQFFIFSGGERSHYRCNLNSD
jgi:hypothetical protein